MSKKSKSNSKKSKRPPIGSLIRRGLVPADIPRTGVARRAALQEALARQREVQMTVCCRLAPRPLHQVAAPTGGDKKN